MSSNPTWLRNLLLAPSFRYRDFRFLLLSTLFNAMSMVGEQVVLGWYVLELTDSAFLVGVAVAVRMAPLFPMGILSGVLADRFDRRLLLRGLNIVQAVGTAGIGVLVLFDLLGLWQLLVLTFAVGSFRAVHITTRQSFTVDIVGQENALNGLSFMSMSMRAGSIVGALSAGFATAHWGAGYGYILLGGFYLLSTIALLPLRSSGQAAPKERVPILENIREFIVEIRHNRILLVLVVITAAVEVLGFSHQVVLPTMAKEVFGVGAAGLGVLTAFRGVGGVLGLILLAALGEVRRKGLLFLVVLHVFGGAMVFLGFAPTFAIAILAVTLVNAMTAMSDVLSQILVQLNVRNEMRGRAMGSWLVAVGTGPLGHMQLGGLVAIFSVGVALSTNGIGLFVLAVGVTLLSPRFRRL